MTLVSTNTGNPVQRNNDETTTSCDRYLSSPLSGRTFNSFSSASTATTAVTGGTTPSSTSAETLQEIVSQLVSDFSSLGVNVDLAALEEEQQDGVNESNSSNDDEGRTKTASPGENATASIGYTNDNTAHNTSLDDSVDDGDGSPSGTRATARRSANSSTSSLGPGVYSIRPVRHSENSEGEVCVDNDDESVDNITVTSNNDCPDDASVMTPIIQGEAIVAPQPPPPPSLSPLTPSPLQPSSRILRQGQQQPLYQHHGQYHQPYGNIEGQRQRRQDQPHNENPYQGTLVNGNANIQHAVQLDLETGEATRLSEIERSDQYVDLRDDNELIIAAMENHSVCSSRSNRSRDQRRRKRRRSSRRASEDGTISSNTTITPIGVAAANDRCNAKVAFISLLIVVVVLIGGVVVAFTMDFGNRGASIDAEERNDHQGITNDSSNLGFGSSVSSSASQDDDELAMSQFFRQVGTNMDGMDAIKGQYGSSISLNGDGTRVAIADLSTVQVMELREAIGDEGEEEEAMVQIGNKIEPPSTSSSSDSEYGLGLDMEELPFRASIVTALSASGDFLAVGWPLLNDESNTTTTPKMHAGAVQVYRYIKDSSTSSSSRWEPIGETLYGREDCSFFGASLSLSNKGGVLAVGAPGGTDGQHQGGIGYAQVYYLNKGTWELRGSSVSGDDLDLTVLAVSLTGDGSSVAVGGIPSVEGGTVAKVFRFVAGDWEQAGSGIARTIGSDAAYLAQISADGRTVVVSNYHIKDSHGNTGRGLDVRAFRWMENMQNWQQLGSNMHEGFMMQEKSGYFVSLSGDGSRIAMGDPGRRFGAASSTGHAHVYEYKGEDWVQIGPNIWGENAADQFGFQVAISGDGQRVAVSSPYNRGQGEERGRVKLFEIL